MNKLNLGCGDDYKDGWINHELGENNASRNKIKSDIQFDLNVYPWELKGNFFDEINARSIIEHLESRTKPWKELRRISKNGCIIDVLVPHYSGYSGYDDPTHYNRYSSNAGLMISEMFGFKLLESEIIFSNNTILKWVNPIVNIFPRFYERFFANVFPSQLCRWKFEVIKNEDKEQQIEVEKSQKCFS